MLVSKRGKGQRSHQDMTLLLLLVLTAGLAGRAHSEDYDLTGEPNIADEDEALLSVGKSEVNPTDETPLTTQESLGDAWSNTDETGLSGEGEALSPEITEEPTNNPVDVTDLSKATLDPLLIIIPLALLILLVIVAAVVAFIISRRRAKKLSTAGDVKEDEYLHGSESEKVPMPMFEDDVPSVLELEMEDLEKWMIKDTGRICLDSSGDES
ncbi:hypothetical protein GJAV_G00063770 [Gymnothorax javanicus]|nr:hypothetical protein GJAV_G00063770 [Gymnothorax javanicus]